MPDRFQTGSARDWRVIWINAVSSSGENDRGVRAAEESWG